MERDVLDVVVSAYGGVCVGMQMISGRIRVLVRRRMSRRVVLW